MLTAFQADAKGPINTPTPEGYIYYYLLVDLFSRHYWAFLCKTTGDWKTLWPNFVKAIEAKLGSNCVVSLIIMDGHMANMHGDVLAFNESKGIQSVFAACESQWQDGAAEAGIKSISSGARCSMIHAGAPAFLWGHAVMHKVESANLLPGPKPVPGHAGKTPFEIHNPTMTTEYALRRLYPFCCLAFKTNPKRTKTSNLHMPKAEPCLYVRYVPSRKAFLLLTLPNLYQTFSIEIRAVSGCFPLRVTNHLSNSMVKFLQPADSEEDHASIAGPGNILQQTRV